MSQNGTDRPKPVAGDEINLKNDGAAVIEAETVNVREGGAGVIKGQTISVREGGAMFVVGQSVSIQEGGSAVVIARQADLKDATVLFLAASKVSGEARVVFDMKAAVIFGAVLGLVVGMLKYLLGQK